MQEQSALRILRPQIEILAHHDKSSVHCFDLIDEPDKIAQISRQTINRKGRQNISFVLSKSSDSGLQTWTAIVRSGQNVLESPYDLEVLVCAEPQKGLQLILNPQIGQTHAKIKNNAVSFCLAHLAQYVIFL